MRFLFAFVAITISLVLTGMLLIGIIWFVLAGIVIARRYYRQQKYWSMSLVILLFVLNAVLWSFVV